MARNFYQLIDHTADIGIEVTAHTKGELFTKAACAFCDLICNLKTVRPVVERKIAVIRDNPAHLLQALLNELLYLFETKHELYPEVVRLNFKDNGLTAVVRGEKIDPARHEIKTGIKAVTFHQLEVKEEGGVWKARVIFDV
ncbi:MAG: archease [Deltaproteobacteria bacterium]|nr:archease [Deltaproteobacteria bacterium]